MENQGAKHPVIYENHTYLEVFRLQTKKNKQYTPAAAAADATPTLSLLVLLLLLLLVVLV